MDVQKMYERIIIIIIKKKKEKVNQRVVCSLETPGLDGSMADRICVLEVLLVFLRGCGGEFKTGKVHSTAGEN